MGKLYFTSSRRVLFVILALLPAACSSTDDRCLVMLDIQLATDVPPPTTIHLTALQGDTDVKSVDVSWKSGSRAIEKGLYVPAGVSGQVTIVASGTVDGRTLEGKTDPIGIEKGGTVGPYPLTLNLSAVTPPVADAGADTGLAPDAGDTRLPTDDGPGSDLRMSDVAADGLGQPDSISPGSDADAAGVPDDDAKDAMLGDARDTVLLADDARDVPLGPEVADTVPPPMDGHDGPVALLDASDAGHSRVWEPAQNIENDPVDTSYEPVIAVDPVNEHVYVAWDEAAAVKVRRWNRVTAAWEKIVTVESRGDPVTPGIGVDASGNVLLVWGQHTGVASVDGVWSSRSTDGSSWSPATRITSDPGFDIRLAVARNGTAHAVYNREGVGWPLFTAYYDGSGWTANPTTLDPNPTSYWSEARIVLSGTGDGLVIFKKAWGVAASVLTGQSFSTPIMLDPNYETVTAYDPSIAMNRKGQAMVVWTEANGSNTALLGRTYDPAVSWSSVLPPIVNKPTVATPAVALDEQNYATLLWQQEAASGANLVAMHGSPTGPWGEVTALETDNVAGTLNLTTEYAYPSVASDGDGNVLAVWRKEVTPSTSTFGAYATQYAGGRWLPEAKLGLKSGLDITGLAVSVADSGFGAATFLYYTAGTTSDTDAYNVMVAFFR